MAPIVETDGPAVPRFQAGGALRPGSLYVERDADRELEAVLLRGEFAYVLAPRQIGKSSLRFRTAAALEEKGLRCAHTDLSIFGEGKTWYRSVCDKLEDELQLGCDVGAFFARHPGIAEAQVLLYFLRQEVLGRVRERVVVFLDEIDAVLSAGIRRDELFAAVRYIYNERAREPAWERLTFCLLGVATPGELMQDPARTPFNVGRAVWLLDFTDDEAQAFAAGLAGLPGGGRSWLDEVLRWTGGNPYMTQRLCAALQEEGAGEPAKRVAALVDELFFEQADENLSYAAKRLKEHEQPGGLLAALQLYRRLLAGEEVPLSEGSDSQMALRLAGLAAVRRRGARLVLETRNRVFTKAYDERWVKEQEGGRALLEAAQRWDAAGRDGSLVLRGQALENARAWAHGREDISPDEREFLICCLEVARRDEESRSRQRGLLARGLLVAAILALGSLLFAVYQARLARRAERQAQGTGIALMAERPYQREEALAQAIRLVAPLVREDSEVPYEALAGLTAAIAAQEQEVELKGHEDILTDARFSSDGTQVVTASMDGTARIWDSRTGTPRGTLRGHKGAVHSAAFSPDGKLVVTAGADGTSRLFEAESGVPIGEPMHLSEVGGPWSVTGGKIFASFSPDGDVLLTGDGNGTIRLFWAATGELLWTFPFVAHSVRFTPDGEYLVVGTRVGFQRPGLIRVVEVNTWRVRYSLTTYGDDYGPQVEFSQDGKRLFWIGSASPIEVFISDVRTGKVLRQFGRCKHPIYRMGSSLSGHVFAQCGSKMQKWNEAGRLLGEVEAGLNLTLISPDGQWALVDGRRDAGVALIRLSDGGVAAHPTSNFQVYPSQTSFSPDGRRILHVTERVAFIWDPRLVHRLPVLAPDEPGYDAWPYGLFSPLFSFDKSRFIGFGKIVEVPAGRLIPLQGFDCLSSIQGRERTWLARSSFSRGAPLFAAPCHGDVRVWDTRTGAALHHLPVEPDWANVVALSPDGEQVAAGGVDGNVYFFDS